MSTSLHRFPNPRRPWRAMAFCTAAAWAGGCAQVLPPPEVLRAAIANPELSLHLVESDHWRIFHVRYATFARRMYLREEPTAGSPPPPPVEVRWKGSARSWPDLATFWINEKFYEKRQHSGGYRMHHPWSGEEWILAARAITHRARSIPLPMPEEQAPRLTFFEKGGRSHKEQRPIGKLAYDEASRLLLFGHLGSQEVEIERVDVLAFDREPGILQHLIGGAYPSSGEYVIRIDGHDTARFLREDHGEGHPTYRLAIRADLGEADRDRSLWLFFAFDRMMAFLRTMD